MIKPIQERNCEVILLHGIVFIRNPYADRIGRGIGLKIKSGGCSSVPFASNENNELVSSPAPNTGNREGGIYIRIGGIKFTYNGADWLIFRNSQRSRGIEIGGGSVTARKP